MEPIDPTPPPPTTTLSYARTGEPRLRVGDYLAQCVTAALFVGLFVGAMAVAGRLKGLFIDFGLKLPLFGQLLLHVHEVYSTLRLGLVLWVIPPVLPLLLARVRPAARRWILLVAVWFALLLLAVVFVGLVLPLLSMLEGISGRSGGAK